VTFTSPARRSARCTSARRLQRRPRVGRRDAPATDWFLAEGATGSFFTTFVLLSNPNATPAHVTMTYLREGGGTVTRLKTIAGRAPADDQRRPRGSVAGGDQRRHPGDLRRPHRGRARDVLADRRRQLERSQQRVRRHPTAATGAWPRAASAARSPSRRSSSSPTRTSAAHRHADDPAHDGAPVVKTLAVPAARA
jgi:hypothetical protein